MPAFRHQAIHGAVARRADDSLAIVAGGGVHTVTAADTVRDALARACEDVFMGFAVASGAVGVAAADRRGGIIEVAEVLAGHGGVEGGSCCG